MPVACVSCAQGRKKRRSPCLACIGSVCSCEEVVSYQCSPRSFAVALSVDVPCSSAHSIEEAVAGCIGQLVYFHIGHLANIPLTHLANGPAHSHRSAVAPGRGNWSPSMINCRWCYAPPPNRGILADTDTMQPMSLGGDCLCHATTSTSPNTLAISCASTITDRRPSCSPWAGTCSGSWTPLR
jgi:hypothetical protein